MTDAHSSWHRCTQALIGDRQEFVHERRGK